MRQSVSDSQTEASDGVMGYISENSACHSSFGCKGGSGSASVGGPAAPPAAIVVVGEVPGGGHAVVRPLLEQLARIHHKRAGDRGDLDPSAIRSGDDEAATAGIWALAATHVAVAAVCLLESADAVSE